MWNFPGSFTQTVHISCSVPEIPSSIGRFVGVVITAAENTETSLVPQPSRKCTNALQSFTGRRAQPVNLFSFLIFLLLDVSSLLSLHVFQKVSWQFLGDFNSFEQKEAAPLLVVSIKPDRKTTCQPGEPERSRTGWACHEIHF